MSLELLVQSSRNSYTTFQNLIFKFWQLSLVTKPVTWHLQCCYQQLFKKFQGKKGWILTLTICATNLNDMKQFWPFLSAAVTSACWVSECTNMLWHMQAEMLEEPSSHRASAGIAELVDVCCAYVSTQSMYCWVRIINVFQWTAKAAAARQTWKVMVVFLWSQTVTINFNVSAN